MITINRDYYTGYQNLDDLTKHGIDANITKKEEIIEMHLKPLLSDIEKENCNIEIYTNVAGLRDFSTEVRTKGSISIGLKNRIDSILKR